MPIGLPVGPIGSPGKTAFDAAANPKANEYLYWVTINLDTKETKFSKTLAEHNGYVEQYNAWCAANADVARDLRAAVLGHPISHSSPRPFTAQPTPGWVWTSSTPPSM